MGGFDDWGELGCGLWGRVFPVEGAGWARPDWKAGGVLDVAVGGAGCRGLSERLYVAPPGEPPRPDELPDQPHPHHSRGDSVHSAQQGAGAGRARCLRQGGVAVCSPRPTRGWVVDGQEPRSPQSWRDVSLDPTLPLGPASATGPLGPGQESAFPLSPIRPSHKGLGLVFFKGLNSSGDLRPSTPGLLHAESYSLAIQSAVLFPALWIPSLVSPSKEDPTEGMGQVGRPPSPDILSSIEPLPRARPRAGLWDPGDSQSCRGDRDGWRGGSLNFQGREGEVSWWS